MNTKALIIVDVQNDFCKGGHLEVPNGDRVVDVINGIIQKFDVVVATQDWHPKNHKSFASNHQGKKVFDMIDLNGTQQVLWPDHCIQNTKGSDLHEMLITDKVNMIIHKGMNPEIDSYSAFADNGKGSLTGLMGYLTEHNVDQIYICGLATDYCVEATAMDAIEYGENFGIEEIFVIEDACRGVDPVSSAKAIEEMKKNGIEIIKSEEI